MIWECKKCGDCCRLAGVLVKFNNGKDLACRYLVGNLCSIYNKRPNVCIIEDYSDIEVLNKACNYIRETIKRRKDGNIKIL